MKIKSRLYKIKEQVLDALCSDKETLLEKYANVLRISVELLKTNELDFWLSQISNNKWELIPTTKSGVLEEMNNWKNYEPSLKTILERIRETSENILVYWSEDDLCDMQGQFYYYKDETLNKVYKESDWGNLIGIEKTQIGSPVIALIPDLKKMTIESNDIGDELYLLPL